MYESFHFIKPRWVTCAVFVFVFVVFFLKDIELLIVI